MIVQVESYILPNSSIFDGDEGIKKNWEIPESTD